MPDVLLRVISNESSPASAKVDAYGFGILGALAMVMTGLFPINHFALHSVFSTCSNILLGTAFAFSVAALRYHVSCPRWLLILGAVTTLSDLLFGLSKIVTTTFVLEWVTIALFIGYIISLGAQTPRRLADTTASWARGPGADRATGNPDLAAHETTGAHGELV